MIGTKNKDNKAKNQSVGLSNARRLPAYRMERVEEVLLGWAECHNEMDIRKVAAELKYLIGEQLAHERSQEMQVSGNY